MLSTEKTEARRKRRLRIRKKVSGTAERPRMCVFKSLRHLSVQIIDDNAGRTLVGVTTNNKTTKAGGKTFANVANAKGLGKAVAEKALAAGIAKVVFDRSGYPYHGVVKALADSAREAGLKF